MEYSNNVDTIGVPAVQTVQTHSMLVCTATQIRNVITICRYSCVAIIERESSALWRCTVSILGMLVQRVAGNAQRECEWVVGNTSFQTSYTECSQWRLHHVCDGMKVQTFECLDIHFSFRCCPIAIPKHRGRSPRISCCSTDTHHQSRNCGWSINAYNVVNWTSSKGGGEMCLLPTKW
jgi:hypothetical protein